MYGRAFQTIVLPAAAIGVVGGLELAGTHGVAIGCGAGLLLFVVIEWLAFCLVWLGLVLRERTLLVRGRAARRAERETVRRLA